MNLHFDKKNTETSGLDDFNSIIEEKIKENYGLTYFASSYTILEWLAKNKDKYSYYETEGAKVVIVYKKSLKEKKCESLTSKDVEVFHILNIPYKDSWLFKAIYNEKEKIANFFRLRIEIKQSAM